MTLNTFAIGDKVIITCFSRNDYNHQAKILAHLSSRGYYIITSHSNGNTIAHESDMQLVGFSDNDFETVEQRCI